MDNDRKELEKALKIHGIDMGDIVVVDGRIHLTAEQIGKGLGYLEPRIYVMRLFHRHKDEIEEYTSVVNLTTEAGKRQTTVFSKEGVMMIALLANTTEAKRFRKGVVKLMIQIEKQEFIHVDQIREKYIPRSWVTNWLKSLKPYLSKFQSWGWAHSKREVDGLLESFPSMNPKKFRDDFVRVMDANLTRKEQADIFGMKPASLGRFVKRLSKIYDDHRMPDEWELKRLMDGPQPIMIEHAKKGDA